MTGGDIATSRELLEIFIKTVPARLQALVAAAAKSDAAEVRFVAHELKSNFVLVGALSMAEALTQLEATCRKTTQAQWQPTIEQVRLRTDQVIDEIRLLLKDDAVLLTASV